MLTMKTEKASSEFGVRLRSIRKAKALTQYQLADMMNVSQRMIAHYETQKTRPPLDKLKEFAAALGVEIEELAGSTETHKETPPNDVSLKIIKRVKVIEQLPIRDQKAIFRLISSLAEKNNIKEHS